MKFQELEKLLSENVPTWMPQPLPGETKSYGADMPDYIKKQIMGPEGSWAMPGEETARKTSGAVSLPNTIKELRGDIMGIKDKIRQIEKLLRGKLGLSQWQALQDD
jgi:hypothetical protein